MIARKTFASAQHGTRLRYVVWIGGKPHRRAVLIHALAMTAELWETVADALGSDWEVLALDCRGLGASGKPSGPYTVELFVKDIDAAMEHAGWPVAFVAGASMGGCVAMAFAALRPDRIERPGLADTTAWNGEAGQNTWEEHEQQAVSGGMEALINFQLTRWFSDAFCAASPDAVDRAVNLFLANDTGAISKRAGCLAVATCATRCPTSISPFRSSWARRIASRRFPWPRLWRQ